MAERFTVAIIGSGPAGLSAAGRAAECGVAHVLLERTDHLSDTIHKYQRGKLVMATPEILALRSPLPFVMSSREEVLGGWEDQTRRLQINVRFNADVRKITGARGAFTLSLADGGVIEAETVVLAIGVQGNLRLLKVPGADLPLVQYQLDDPEAYRNETIVVVGAGDSAIENAVALARQNRVVIVNRRGEFARAKTGNLAAITRAIDSGQIEAVFNAAPLRINARSITTQSITLSAGAGETTFDCDRILCRLGADPPRQFLESCGIVFATKDPGAFPLVSDTYESNVPGLYVIGALAGYPLIKHCMNQGYEVIETIRGVAVEPADQPLLEAKFAAIPGRPKVAEVLDYIQRTVLLTAGLTKLQLREFLLDGEVKVYQAGDKVFERHVFDDSLFLILTGIVEVEIDPNDRSLWVQIGQGGFIGEMGLISGRRRLATVWAKTDCVLIEVARRAALKLINSVPAAQRMMDEVVTLRQLQGCLSPTLTRRDLDDVIATAKVVEFAAGEKLITEGATDNSVFVIRSGSVTVSRRIDGRDIVLAYIPAGHYVGEMALLHEAPRSATVTAAIKTTAIRVDGAPFRRLLRDNPHLVKRLNAAAQNRVIAVADQQAPKSRTSLVEFLVKQGAGEAVDMLLIDEALCVRCDNCERACAETHSGVSRLDREAGPTFAMIHVPTSCRHCEHPHCMSDCPPDAIHRAPGGEVFIDDKTCIGCGNCETNCPYGVIHMAEEPPPKPSLLLWLLFGFGPGPGEDKKGKTARAKAKAKAGGKQGAKLAVKCDMCKDIVGGAACVRACPTGAAIRVKPEQFLNLTRRES